MERKSWVLAIVALVAFGAFGQTLQNEWVLINGRAFAAERVSMVKKGSPRAEVKKLIGPPLSITMNNGLERWKYHQVLELRTVTPPKDGSSMDRLRRWVRSEPSVEHTLVVDFSRGAVVGMTFTDKH